MNQGLNFFNSLNRITVYIFQFFNLDHPLCATGFFFQLSKINKFMTQSNSIIGDLEYTLNPQVPEMIKFIS